MGNASRDFRAPNFAIPRRLGRQTIWATPVSNILGTPFDLALHFFGFFCLAEIENRKHGRAREDGFPLISGVAHVLVVCRIA